MDEHSTQADCSILIPAYNEEQSIATVIRSAAAARLGPVLVVDDGSTDATAEVAHRAGADVLRLPHNKGKGGAVFAGASRLSSEVVILLDADLTGLSPSHLRALAVPVMKGEVDMSRGVFKGGRWSTTAAQKIVPHLTGQRAIRRTLLLELDGLQESRYGIEVVITEAARKRNWRTCDVPLPGVSQVMKEEKLGLVQGVGRRLRMYGDIVLALAGFKRQG
jgi:glycosyltransferase involved in cell wall biosynthesis